MNLGYNKICNKMYKKNFRKIRYRLIGAHCLFVPKRVDKVIQGLKHVWPVNRHKKS